MPPIEFRGDTTLLDLDGTADLIRSHWPKYVDLFRAEVAAYASVPIFRPFYVQAIDGGQVVGLALMMASVMSTNLNAITWVCVKAALQGKGIGREVVSRCLTEAKAQGRSVVPATSTPGFYTALGFSGPVPYGDDTGHFLMTMTPR